MTPRKNKMNDDGDLQSNEDARWTYEHGSCSKSQSMDAGAKTRQPLVMARLLPTALLRPCHHLSKECWGNRQSTRGMPRWKTDRAAIGILHSGRQSGRLACSRPADGRLTAGSARLASAYKHFEQEFTNLDQHSKNNT